MLQGVIFDLDGVILDSHPAHKQAWKALLASAGKQVSDQELEVVQEGLKFEAILQHWLGEVTSEQVKHYGARKEALLNDSQSCLKTIDGFQDFLQEIVAARLPIGLASSAGRRRVDLTLEQLGLKHHFCAIVTGDDVAQGKPDPAICRQAARGMGVDPNHILVCEDAVNGVEAAKRAGMKCLGIATSEREPILKHAGADRVVPDFTAVRLGDLRRLFC